MMSNATETARVPSGGRRPRAARHQLRRQRHDNRYHRQENSLSFTALDDLNELQLSYQQQAAGQGYLDQIKAASTNQPESARVNKWQYRPRLAYFISIIQIACGLMVFVGGFIAVLSGALQHEKGVGLWSGVWMMVAGGVGFTTAKWAIRPRLISLYALMVAVSIALGLVCFAFGLNGAIVEGSYISSGNMPANVGSFQNLYARIASHVLLLVFGACQTIASCVALGNCLRELCCHQKRLVRRELNFHNNYGIDNVRVA